ncbi:MAG: hypothetical protein ACOZNI_19600 [Myxococcota bacterium]
MLLALTFPALAVDLEVSLTPPQRWTPEGFTEGPEVSMTFHDIGNKHIPAFLVPMSDGTHVRVTVEASPVSETQWTLDMRLEQLERRGRSERVTLISSPRITTLTNEVSSVTQGMRGPVNGEMREASWSVELVVRDE